MKRVSPPFVFVSQLCGFVAQWAVQQSPYNAPDGLTEVLKEFKSRAEGCAIKDFCLPDCILAERKSLLAMLKSQLLTIPQVGRWNERKNGNQSPFAFSSRYGKPNPDDDFIDLDALIRNIARSCVQEDERNWRAHVESTRWTPRKIVSWFRCRFSHPVSTAEIPEP